MSKFVHVDPSLTGVGGHEFDGALSILQAAETAGYEVALGASRRFRNRTGLPDHWPVYALFPGDGAASSHVSANDGTDLDGSRLQPAPRIDPQHLRGGLLAPALTALLAARNARYRRRCTDRFAHACRRLFAKLDLQPGDQVFFQTISMFEFLGLADYLADTPQAKRVDWHLQFHDDPLEQCEPGEAEQAARRATVRRQLDRILGKLPVESLHLYSPTEALAAQYSRLGAATFRCLPHPVNPVHQSSGGREKNVLQVTCAGSVRREKGYRGLRTLLTSLRADPVFDARLELVVQLSQRKGRRLGVVATKAGQDNAHVPLTLLPHPLQTDAYRNLICQTDIGLFLYDHRRYRYRCSAVLQEMLAAGKPVIVPAGCWLADQVAEPTFCHLETLQQVASTIRHAHGSDLAWYTLAPDGTAQSHHGDQLSFTHLHALVAEMSVPKDATEVLVSFRRKRYAQTESYVSVQTEQLDASGTPLGRFDTVLGQRTGSENVLTLHRLRPQTARLRLRLSNAGNQQSVVVKDLQLRFLNSRASGGCPAGSVGLVAARHAHIPELLRDMTEHYHHYLESAAAFSSGWREASHPSRTIEILAANARNRITLDQAASGRRAWQKQLTEKPAL